MTKERCVTLAKWQARPDRSAVRPAASAPPWWRGLPRGAAAAVLALVATPLRAWRALRVALREEPGVTRGALAGALVSLVLYLTWRHVEVMSMVDMVVYRAEGAAVLHGGDLYSLRVSSWNLPATYPPFAALLFAPTALVGVPVLRVLVTAGNVLLLGVLVHQSCRLARWPRPGLRPALVLLGTGFGVWLEPVFNTLRYGQINLLLAVLVLHDLLRDERARGRGVLIGLAAGIKVTPAFFAVYLLCTGQVRAAVRAACAGAVTVAVGALALPRASWDFWSADLYDTSRVGKEYIVDNQSLRGGVDRLLHTPHSALAAPVLSGVVLVLGLGVAVALHRRAAGAAGVGVGAGGAGTARAEAWSVVCAALTCVLVSPISWTHHWVWCVPLLVLLAAEAGHERARQDGRVRWRVLGVATGLAFCSFSMWLVPHQGDTDLTVPAVLQVFASLYPVLGCGFLALNAVRLARRPVTAVAPALPGPRKETTVGGGGRHATPEVGWARSSSR